MSAGEISPAAARAAVATALSGLASVGGSLLLSVLFLRRFGASVETDGFYGALSVYLLAVLLGPALRIIGPAWASSVGDRAGRHLVGAVAVGAALVAVTMAALAYPASQLLAVGEGQDVARAALLVLAPSAGLQLYGAAQAASLQLAGRFDVPAVGYAAAAIASVIAFLALEPVLGIDAMAAAMACNAVVLVGVQWFAGAARPQLLGLRELARAWAVLISGGAAVLSVSVVTVVSTSLLARTAEEGSVTVFSYAIYIVYAIYGFTGSAVAVVVADRARRDVGELVPTWRLALLPMAPLIFASIAGGATVAGALLGFSDSLTDELRRDLALMLLWAPATALLALGASYLASHRRIAALMLCVGAVVAGHVVASLLLRELLGEEGIVLAAGLTPVVAAAAVFALARPAAPRTLLRGVAAAAATFLGLAAAPALAAWAVVLLLGVADAPVAAALSALVGMGAYALLLSAARVPEGDQVLRVLRRGSA